MGEAYITRRGGAGGMSLNAALLHINAPVGSAITIQKEVEGVYVDFATLPYSKGHTNAADTDFADWYYSIGSAHYLPSGCNFKVISTLGTNSDEAILNITSNKQYDFALDYPVWVIRNGQLQDGYTLYPGTIGELSQKPDYVYVKNSTSSSGGNCCIGPVPDTDYKYLILVTSDATVAANNVYQGWGIDGTNEASSYNDWDIKARFPEKVTSAPATWTMDVTDLYQQMEGKYIKFQLGSSGGNANLNITQLYFTDELPS